MNLPVLTAACSMMRIMTRIMLTEMNCMTRIFPTQTSCMTRITMKTMKTACSTMRMMKRTRRGFRMKTLREDPM